MTNKTKTEFETLEEQVFSDNFRKTVVAECHGDETKADRFIARAKHHFRMNPALTSYAVAAADTSRMTQTALMKFAPHDFPFTGDFVFLQPPFHQSRQDKHGKTQWNPPVADFFYRGLAALCTRTDGFHLFHPIVVLWDDDFSIHTNFGDDGKKTIITHKPKLPENKDEVGKEIQFDDIRGVVIAWKYKGITDAHFVEAKWLRAARDNAPNEKMREIQHQKWDRHPRIFAEKTALKRTVAFLPIAVLESSSDMEGEVIPMDDATKYEVSPQQPATPPPTAPEPPPTDDPPPPTAKPKKAAAKKAAESKPDADKNAPPPDLSAPPPTTETDNKTEAQKTADNNASDGAADDEDIPF